MNFGLLGTLGWPQLLPLFCFEAVRTVAPATVPGGVNMVSDCSGQASFLGTLWFRDPGCSQDGDEKAGATLAHQSLLLFPLPLSLS